jgi:hypothetical protein
VRVGGMRGPESRTLGPIGTVGRYRLAKELTHCWLADLATMVTGTLEPAHLSVWLRERE